MVTNDARLRMKHAIRVLLIKYGISGDELRDKEKRKKIINGLLVMSFEELCGHFPKNAPNLTEEIWTTEIPSIVQEISEELGGHEI